MANTHHTGIPLLQWAGAYPPCTPSVVISADINPFCAGDSVTFIPTLSCVTDVIITAYAWVLNGSIVSASVDPYVNAALNDGDTVYFLFTTSVGNTYFSNVITMVEKMEGCEPDYDYGIIYNGYAVNDARGLAETNFRVGSITDWFNMRNYVDPIHASWITNDVAKKLKVVDYNGTNDYNFDLIQVGYRDSISGAFIDDDSHSYFFTSSVSPPSPPNTANRDARITTADNLDSFSIDWKTGAQLRLAKITLSAADLLKSDGEYCDDYTDFDGNVYKTVKIGNQVWTTSNLIVRHFSNGDEIPFHGLDNPDNFTDAEWIALTTPGCCPWDNDWDNI